MPQLDFKEIPQANLATGEQDTFEMLARDFFEMLGYKVLSGPDRGSDLGRDLVIAETRAGVGGETLVKWLVSCKHKAHFGQSVGLTEEQDISDRLRTHNCVGFIGFYSTLPGSSLTKKLEGMKRDNPLFEYQVFDKGKIESVLLGNISGQTVAQRYFPKSFNIHPNQNQFIEETKIIVRDVVQDVFDKNFIRLQETAQIEAQRRVDLLKKGIFELAANQLDREQLNHFSEPDVQYALYEAIKAGARNDSQSLRDILAALIVERIKREEDLQKIVYNEAISTLGKLTRNQLDILALCFVVNQHVNSLRKVLIDWQSYFKELEYWVKPFINCKIAYADITHLQYSSCVYFPGGEDKIIATFRRYLPLIFQNPVSENQIASIKLPPDNLSRIFTPLEVDSATNEKIYIFKEEDYEPLAETYSESHLKLYHDDLSSKQILQISKLLKKSIVSAKEVNNRLPDWGKALDAHWRTSIRKVSLTTVGLILAVSHIEQTLKEKFDVSEWFS